MKIQVLGTGCSKCNTLAKQAEEAARQLGVDCELEKLNDIKDIMKMGVMTTPALAIDGVVKVVGKVPSVEELKKIISTR